ncbi:MAG: hypothetical protein ACQRW7_11660 [Caulobacterales bacterium]|uniref:hypothetical protein n=1 Tax=Glycocaulis sp. TaxID=1969725 RepID=UPI003FA191C1
MKNTLLAGAALALVCAGQSMARPVSYEGGWTVIGEHDRANSAIWAHYTPHHRYSIGYRGEWHREDDHAFHGLQATWLARRWFGQGYQANVYLSGAGGLAYGTGDNPAGTGPAGSIGVMADWETRRWFVSYMARGFSGETTGASAMQAARIGVAPYVANYGALHTWLMVQVEHMPEADEPVGVTPLVRFFQGPLLAEAGWSLTDDRPFFQIQYRF